MREKFIYITSVVQTAILVALVMIGANIAANIKEFGTIIIQHIK
jgi:hypothetical protein